MSHLRRIRCKFCASLRRMRCKCASTLRLRGSVAQCSAGEERLWDCVGGKGWWQKAGAARCVKRVCPPRSLRDLEKGVLFFIVSKPRKPVQACAASSYKSLFLSLPLSLPPPRVSGSSHSGSGCRRAACIILRGGSQDFKLGPCTDLGPCNACHRAAPETFPL